MTYRISLLALLSIAAWAAPAFSAEKARPNILFCFADDWGRYAGAYADVDGRPSPSQVVQTPNIDRVAGEGVLFNNAFVTAPSCTPCRSSILSGQYFFRTGRGAILQGAEWDAKIPSFPPLLEQAGYHLGETYKVWSPGTPNDAPYGAGKFGYEKAGRTFNTFSQRVTKMVADGVPLEEAKQKLYGEVRGNFDAFLDDAEGRPAVLLLVRADQRASQVGQGLRQGAVGYRSRRAGRQAADVSARRAGSARRTSPIIWAKCRPSTPRWACCWNS